MDVEGITNDTMKAIRSAITPLSREDALEVVEGLLDELTNEADAIEIAIEEAAEEDD